MIKRYLTDCLITEPILTLSLKSGVTAVDLLWDRGGLPSNQGVAGVHGRCFCRNQQVLNLDNVSRTL